MLRLACWRLLFVVLLAKISTLACSRRKDPSPRRVLLVAGNFSINGERANLAQYDVATSRWLSQYNHQLFQYAADNAVIYDVAVNRSKIDFDEVYVAGLFDTTSKMSQAQLCSVSKFDGIDFEKVGEGLCSRGDISSIAVQTIVAGSGGDLFVGGSFATRLWDGHHFSYVYQVARYDAVTAAWVPLSGGGEFSCKDGEQAKVNSLVWDNTNDILYIGGNFDSLDSKNITKGLAVWSPKQGVINFNGGGVSDDNLSQVHSMVYEPQMKSLFVAGAFSRVNGQLCSTIAVWNTVFESWACLFSSTYGFELITAIALDSKHFYVGGIASRDSNWNNVQPERSFKYTVAALDISGFVDEIDANHLPSKQNWKWLADFMGVPGPIQRLVAGIQNMSGKLIIAVDSTSVEGDKIPLIPAVLIWTPSEDGKSGSITPLGGNRYPVDGFVSSVVDAWFQQDDAVEPPAGETHDNDYTFFILLSCVVLGVVLGLGFTISCFYKSNESELLMIQGNPSFNPAMGIPLKTLSGDYGNTVDFKQCFERAMKTRHLSTYETLIIINPKEIMLSRIIGEGSFGRVWSGHWRNNAVAVKEFVFAQAAIAGGSLQRTNIVEEIVGEAGVMACLRHPKILQLYGCSVTMQAIWIVSELCIRGSLKMLLMDPNNFLTLPQSLSILIDVADGMQYLHQRNPPIIHRDLKSHNIFVTETAPGKFIAKIGDWGSARAVALTGSKSMTQGVGTACWLSPEVINNAHFSKASDVYAFGIILWEVHTRQEIYDGLSAAQIIAKVAHEGLRPTTPRDCSWSKLMTQCWKQDPNSRPTFEVILNTLSKLLHKILVVQHHATKIRDRSGDYSRGKALSGNYSVNSPMPADHQTSENSDVKKSLKSNSSFMELSNLAQSRSTMADEEFNRIRFSDGQGKNSSSSWQLRGSSKYSSNGSSVKKLTPTQEQFDSFHPSLENLEVGHGGFRINKGKDESSAHHLAPEIAALHLGSKVESGESDDEPPDPLDFLFQSKRNN